MPKQFGGTTKGMYCSPGAQKGIGKEGDSCYTRQQLVAIAEAYNAKYKPKISTSGTKEQIWHAIEAAMVDQCDNEWCWADKLGIPVDAFRHIRPVGKTSWLSTTDIRNVLKQYEEIHPDFIFLGPTSIDFCTALRNEVCKIDLATSKRNGKTKIGIVFNTDPSTEPGKHWISMFIDISHPDPSHHEIGYFDSFGISPLLPEIKTLIGNLKRQNPQIKLKLNCSGDICTRSMRHQKGGSECGVYSIHFIVSRLSGQTWEDIVIHNVWTDEQMVKLRQKYFRPHKGPKHVD
jgi:hypothetical protein